MKNRLRGRKIRSSATQSSDGRTGSSYLRSHIQRSLLMTMFIRVFCYCANTGYGVVTRVCVCM